MDPKKTETLEQYRPPEALSMTERLVHFMVWARGKFPKQHFPVNKVYQAIAGVPRAPALKSREAELLRGRISGARRLLHANHGCGLITVKRANGDPGGIRATVDSEDQLKTEVAGCAKRHASSGKALGEAAALVDIRKVPGGTLENQQWKSWYQQSSLRDQVARLTDPAFLAKLMPPNARISGKSVPELKKTATG